MRNFGALPNVSVARLTRTSLRAVLSVALLIGTAGCGLLFTQGPPRGHQQMDYFTCTESNTGPAVDVIWAGLSAMSAALIAADPDEVYGDPTATIAINLGWAVASGTAAVIGFNRTRRCREAKRAWAERQRDRGP